MRRVVEFLVAMLPLDPPGRRAVDETLADWRHEAGEATSVTGRTTAAARGCVAIAAAVTLMVVRDVTSAQTFRVAGAALGLALLMSIAVSGRPFALYAAFLAERGADDVRLLAIWASLIPQAISLGIPLALLAPPVRRAASRSLVGACLVLTVVSASNLGWVMPWTNQWFRQTTSALLRPSAPQKAAQPQALPRNVAEYTVTDLVREARQAGAQGRRATGTLSSRGMLLVMVPVCLVVGVQVRRFAAVRRWKRGAGVIAWLVLGGGWLAATFGAAAAIELLRGQYYIELSAVLSLHRMWFVPVVCSSLALAIAGLVHRATPRRDDAQPIFF